MSLERDVPRLDPLMHIFSLSPGPQMNYPEGYSYNLAIGEGDEVGYQDSLTLSIMSTLGVWK